MSKEIRDWRELAEAASKESDPDKLMLLLLELSDALEANTQSKARPLLDSA
jgi:hypothetical protein